MEILRQFAKNLEKELSSRKGGGSSSSSSSGIYSNSGTSYFDKKMNPIKKTLLEDKELTIDELNNYIKNLENKSYFNVGYYNTILLDSQETQRLTFLAFARRSRAKLEQKQAEKEYIAAIKLDENNVTALEYYGELLIQMNQLTKSEDDKIDIFDIYDTLHKNNIQPELGELTKALCGWKKNASEGLNFFFKKQLNSGCTLFNTANSNTDDD